MALLDLSILHSLQLLRSDITKIKCDTLHFFAYLYLYTATILSSNKTSGIGIDVPQATAPAKAGPYLARLRLVGRRQGKQHMRYGIKRSPWAIRVACASAHGDNTP